MGIFDKEIAIIRDINLEVLNTIIETIKRFDFVILDYQINKQHDQKGEDAKGKRLGDYSGKYARIRIRKGLQADHVDLHFTGNFHAELDIITESDQFKIVSTVKYSQYLIKRYGKDVLGIQQKYLEDFVENYILPQIKNMINDKFAKSGN